MNTLYIKDPQISNDFSRQISDAEPWSTDVGDIRSLSEIIYPLRSAIIMSNLIFQNYLVLSSNYKRGVRQKVLDRENARKKMKKSLVQSFADDDGGRYLTRRRSQTGFLISKFKITRSESLAEVIKLVVSSFMTL